MFEGFDFVIASFSNRRHQNMSLFYGDTASALDNRKKFLSGLGIDSQALICTQQVHGGNIRMVNEREKGCGALSYTKALLDSDALVTTKKNLPLAVFTADCLSLFLLDPCTPAIGLLHAGWRSSQERIAAKTVRRLQKEFGSQPKELRAAFGPALRSCCYEVEKEFQRYFPASVFEKDATYYFDLIHSNKKQLLASGMKEKNIFDSGICTSCQNKDYFSYRKEGRLCGRIISVMMLK